MTQTHRCKIRIRDGWKMKTEYKCVVISDTHGNMQPIREVIEKERPFDTLVHCGDVEGNLASFLGVQEFGCLSVKGNCDYYSDDAEERRFRLGSCRILVTHGHRCGVQFGREMLIREGQKKEADVILYGHTHIPDVYRDKTTGILLVNPGSLCRPRQNTHVKTYAVLTVTEGKIPQAWIREFHV